MPYTNMKDMHPLEVEVWMKRLSALSLETQITRVAQEVDRLQTATVEKKMAQVRKIDSLVKRTEDLMGEIDVFIAQLNRYADQLEEMGL